MKTAKHSPRFIAVQLKPMYEQAARERQIALAGTRPNSGDLREIFPQGAGKSRDLAGKAVGVSGKSVDAAQAILENGTPELLMALENGEVSLFVARDVALALGYADPDDAVRRHCKFAKPLNSGETPGFYDSGDLHPRSLLIPESDVYRH